METTKKDLYAHMHTHYQNWASSGESQTGYYKQHKLSFAKFNYWVRKLRTSRHSPLQEASGFIAVELGSIHTPVLEISHKNGHRISFYGKVEARFIKELLS